MSYKRQWIDYWRLWRGEICPPPPLSLSTLVTEELSKMQSTLTAHTKEMTRAIDKIGMRHTERLFNQEKIFMEKRSRCWMMPGDNMLSNVRSLMLSYNIHWMVWQWWPTSCGICA